MPENLDDDGQSVTDAELGIGQENAPAIDPANPVAALLASPQFAALIEAAVDARLAQMGKPSSGTEMAQLTKALERMVNNNVSQQPGYIKPLPGEEIERRAAAWIDLKAHLKHCRESRAVLTYLLTDDWPAGDVTYPEGMTVNTYLTPGEHMRPLSPAAQEAVRLMLIYSGGPTIPIEDQVAEAEAASRSGDREPPMFRKPSDRDSPSPVEVVDTPLRSTKPKRQMGGVEMVEMAAGPRQQKSLGQMAPDLSSPMEVG